MIYAATLALGFLAGGQLPGSSVMRGSSAVMQATEVCDATSNCGHAEIPCSCRNWQSHMAAALILSR